MRNPMAGRPYGRSGATSGLGGQPYNIQQALGQQGGTPWQMAQMPSQLPQGYGHLGKYQQQQLQPPTTPNAPWGGVRQAPTFRGPQSLMMGPTNQAAQADFGPAYAGSGLFGGVPTDPTLQAFAAQNNWTIVPAGTPGAVVGGFPGGLQMWVIPGY